MEQQISNSVLAILTPEQRACYRIGCQWMSTAVVAAAESDRSGHMPQKILFECAPKNDYHALVNGGVVVLPHGSTQPIYEPTMIHAPVVCVAREHAHQQVGGFVLMQTHG